MRLPYFLLLCLCLWLGTLSLSARADALAPIAWDANAQGQFITSLCRDTHGLLWIGTEDQGVWRLDPSAPKNAQYTHFTTKDGLGDDNAYALVCDKAGRVWAGTLNHGVSVFNGKSWRTYGPLDGPLGSRVFALAVSPADGGVWGATEAGLFRYAHSHWTYFTRADGLPADQANALAFDADGTLYVGTQCDGMAIASPADGYHSWRVVPGPRTLPNAATGDGLPSALINCLLVTQSGTVMAGTTTGLAESKDEGQTWHYRRGVDWKDKLAGLYHPVTPDAKPIAGDLLSEDYVTCLGEDGAGRIFIGHRQKGMEAFDPKTWKRVQSGADGARTDDYVSALLVDSKAAWVGLYSGGLLTPLETSPPESVPTKRTAAIYPELPVPAKPPTLAEMNAMLAQLSRVPSLADESSVVQTLDDDWATQGTWVDRYGNFAAVLCAMNGGGYDQMRGYRAAWVGRHAWVGRNGASDDFLRYWVQEIRTDDTRSLQNMLYGGRKEAEWDDHGETKVMSLDGPHVYGTLKVPKGRYILSCYEFNKDGHEGSNRYRDYLLQVKVTPMPEEQFHWLGAPVGTPGREAEELFDQTPGGAVSRVCNFRGGVWKRFYVNVPDDGFVTVKVNRNYSLNAILCGIFLDPVGPLCGPQGPVHQPAKPHLAVVFKKPATVLADTALHLMDRLLVLRDANPVWYSQGSRRPLLMCLRQMYTPDVSKTSMAQEIDKSLVYENFQQDLASCLNDAQLFDERDKVFYNPNYYHAWAWAMLTDLAQRNNWDGDKYVRHGPWPDELFQAYVAQRQAQNVW